MNWLSPLLGPMANDGITLIWYEPKTLQLSLISGLEPLRLRSAPDTSQYYFTSATSTDTILVTMAYRRSLTTRATLIARAYNPSFNYIIYDHDHKQKSPDETLSRTNIHSFIQSRSFGSSLNNSYGLGNFFHSQRVSQFSLVPSVGSAFCRYMSTTVGEGADKIELISDVADVFTETTVQAIANQAPAVNEVAIAAADSFLPVAALQHFIDAMHNFTGFNWWASIIVTTLLIRTATVPLLINQLKSTSKLTLMRPRLEEIKQDMQDKAMDPMAVADGQKQMQNLFKEYGVHPLTPLKGLFIQGPVFISFFLACNMQEGLEGNPAAVTMKNISRGFAVLSIPLTMTFPKAIFCYWITSNFFSLVYGLVLKVPGVKKMLGVPEIPVVQQTTDPKPSFSLFSAIKQASEAKAARQASASVTAEQPKSTEQKISSSAVLSQRIRSLEKQVKGRKKNKKR
ncbi:mitochondrial inner membrane protein OXA1 [Citrus sinensis]|nr:mitochondrial inner membrane protein OXA1 [Citrus sinensis]